MLFKFKFAIKNPNLNCQTEKQSFEAFYNNSLSESWVIIALALLLHPTHYIWRSLLKSNRQYSILMTTSDFRSLRCRIIWHQARDDKKLIRPVPLKQAWPMHVTLYQSSLDSCPEAIFTLSCQPFHVEWGHKGSGFSSSSAEDCLINVAWREVWMI